MIAALGVVIVLRDDQLTGWNTRPPPRQIREVLADGVDHDRRIAGLQSAIVQRHHVRTAVLDIAVEGPDHSHTYLAHRGVAVDANHLTGWLGKTPVDDEREDPVPSAEHYKR